MKRILVILLVALLAASWMSGCGKTGETPAVDPSQDQQGGPIQVGDLRGDSGEQTGEQAGGEEESGVSQTGEGDFTITDFGDGTCEVSSCTAEGSRIQVPETLGGCKVIGIGTFAFNCVSAQEIILPDTVEYIDNYAFNGCEKLKTVSLGSGLKQTGQMIFNTCNALEKVEFPEGMTTMNYLAFGGCAELGEVVIPASVTEIPNGITFPGVCPKIVIVTPAGSVADQVARDNGLSVRNP